MEACCKVCSEHIGGNSGSEHAEAVPMRTGGCGHTDANLPQDVLRCSTGGSVHTETRRTEQSVFLGGSVHAEGKGHKRLRLSWRIVHTGITRDKKRRHFVANHWLSCRPTGGEIGSSVATT